MKTVLTSLLALVVSVGSFAHSTNEGPRAAKCCQSATMDAAIFSPALKAFEAPLVLEASENFETRMAGLDNAYENQQGLLHFQQTMSAALNQLHTERLLSAMDDLQSAAAFTRTMTGALMQLESGKHAEAAENENATRQFNNLMEKTLQRSSAL